MFYIMVKKKCGVLLFYEYAMFKYLWQILANFKNVTKNLIGQGFQISLPQFIIVRAVFNSRRSLNLILTLLRSKIVPKENHKYSLTQKIKPQSTKIIFFLTVSWPPALEIIDPRTIAFERSPHYKQMCGR